MAAVEGKESMDVPANGQNETNGTAERRAFTKVTPALVTCLKMAILPLIGVVLIILHHFFYLRLSNQPVFPYAFVFHGWNLDKPEWALTIGNAIASTVKFCFSIAIGIVFVQRFWHALREEHYTIEELDAIFAAQSGPYTWIAWRRATGLAILAALALCMSAMSIFPPAALTVKTSPIPIACNILNVDLKDTSLFVGTTPSPALSTLAFRTLEVGSYVPFPLSPCGECSYNVTYAAPALNCSHVDIASSPFIADTVNITVLWNSTTQLTPDGDVGVYVWSRQGNISLGNYTSPEIILCTNQNATYDVGVVYINGTHVAATTSLVPSVGGSTGSNPTVEETAYDAILEVFGETLNGALVAVTSADGKSVSTSSNTAVTTSPLGTLSSTSWTLNSELLTTFPMFMKNISIGLLAGSVTPDSTSSSLEPVRDAVCYSRTTVYNYNKKRLLIAYGAGLFVTLVCVAFGFQSVRVHGGASLEFSRLVHEVYRDPKTRTPPKATSPLPPLLYGRRSSGVDTV
ncbi:hypothetical protein BD410DRAFT_901421 [Rickenella mellea]|uniref:Uncharacterized protein n=1 Tax=Rickenella mellea TaxID=50990 RepID=A0A4Y7PR02_9AGAM|nr:hypothetical protein BD410DRAFT_901421 [Rickenella mellea]